MTTTICDLPEKLKQFEQLYWWLEYWGDWARSETCRGMSIFERLEKYGEDRILSTAPEQFPIEIQVLERALARLRLENRFQFKIIAMKHIGKVSDSEIVSAFGIRRRGLERTLWRAYYFLDPLVKLAGLYEKPAAVC